MTLHGSTSYCFSNPIVSMFSRTLTCLVVVASLTVAPAFARFYDADLHESASTTVNVDNPSKVKPYSVQPSRDALLGKRGAAYRYHYHAVQSWAVSAAGEVRNVYV